MTRKAIVRALLPRCVRNWVRSPDLSLEWVYDDLSFRAGRRVFFQIRPDWRVVCHPVAYKHGYSWYTIDNEVIAELDGFISHCRRGMVLFDIGAHFGVFSLAALHYGGPEAIAIAVDPSPAAIRILKIQARLNKVEDRLRIVLAAASDNSGFLDLLSTGVTGNLHFLPPDDEHPASDLTRVRALTVDQLVHETGLEPTHIKIDVEGQEEAVLRGAHIVLAQTGPIVALELHNEAIRNRGGDPGNVIDMLREAGYEIFKGGKIADPTAILAKPVVRVIAKRPVS